MTGDSEDRAGYAVGLLPYGPPLDDRTAEAALAGAERHAHAIGCRVVIAVVEPNGTLRRFARMEDSNYGSIDLAIGKAETATNFRVSSLFFKTLAQDTSGVWPIAGAVAIEGGLPIISEGRVIGGIGVSGASAADDGRIAAAGLAAAQQGP